MSDYLNKNFEPSMPEEVANPQARKVYEKEARQQLANMNSQPLPNYEDPYANDEKVIVRNNRAHAQHFVDAGEVIPGQVQNDSRGPFAFISKRKLNSEMQLMMALEEQPNGRRPPLSIVDKETYAKEYRIFNERRKEREKMDAQHRALNMDEMDAAQEDFKVHYNVLENVQPEKAIPSHNEGKTDIGPSIKLDDMD